MFSLGKKKFDNKWYNYKTSTQNYNKAHSIANIIKESGDRVRINTTFIKKKRTFNIFIRKGTRDKKPKKPSWKKTFEAKAKQLEKIRQEDIEKRKPIIVREYTYTRNGKEIHVDTFNRKKPIRHKFKRL